ncbi:tRNA (adenosine(37)-N6)-threonylcarbamoyltransferase complex ATPase subunit type 1 TsaE [Candidatus Giovannonibacteria bacterium]|nr:tRNA (adenosine(37)-N6)-threonylcarbamoyltransferase complex ATPase subunit type 1 TsaE [Candidatus Giovannonibacteria bacterium]
MKEVLKAITKNPEETKKFARVLAEEIVKTKPGKGAVVIGLEGELGAGKTTFAKGFARGLGIKEEMKSPTFILMRVFRKKNRNFFHIDAYRDQLDFREFLKSNKNILLVEWSNKVKKFLPKNYFLFKLRHAGSDRREIKLYA